MATEGSNNFIESWDPTHRIPYYINEATKAALWELPEGGVIVAKVGLPDAAESAGGGAGEAAPAPAAADTSVKEGWLHKSGPSGGGWKKRWVVLNSVEQTLRYYGNNPRHTMSLYRVTEEAKGVLNMKSAEAKKAPESVSKSSPTSACIELKTEARTTYFCAKDTTTLESWLTALRVASVGTKGEDASGMMALRPRLDVSAAPREGKLLKTAPDGRTWTERWAKLDPSTKTLVYYEDATKAKAKGLVDLRLATITVGVEEPTLRDMPCFQVHSTRRTFGFVASSRMELQEWLDLIQAAINTKPHYRIASGVKEGYLQKSDPKGRNWKQRWFVLDAPAKQLRYFVESGGTEKGAINLEGATAHMGTKEVSFPTVFSLVLTTESRVYYLAAAETDELIEWFDTICSVPGVVARVGASVTAPSGPKK